MASYWPTPEALSDDPIVAGKMNHTPKIVVSTTLKKADWNNTRLIKDDLAAEINRLKQQPGKDMAIFGSSDLATSFTQLGLMDEYRIMVNPVILGGGKPVFQGMRERVPLKLIKTRMFRSGNVLLYYEPVKK